MRNIRSSALSFLVQKCRISNKEAVLLIANGRLTINGTKASSKQAVLTTDEVYLDGEPLQIPQKFTYVLYYKPRGVESTLNKSILHNLTEALQGLPRLFPVGRLDKDSEGLLLLTDDGKLYNKIAHSKQVQEKEYEVEVDKALTDTFLSKMAEGMEILGQTTLPTHVQELDSHTFKIILTQGLNRQIRRMCYKGGYKVTRLKRTRIMHLHLGELAEGQWRHLNGEEEKTLP